MKMTLMMYNSELSQKYKKKNKHFAHGNSRRLELHDKDRKSDPDTI